MGSCWVAWNPGSEFKVMNFRIRVILRIASVLGWGPGNQNSKVQELGASGA